MKELKELFDIRDEEDLIMAILTILSGICIIIAITILILTS